VEEHDIERILREALRRLGVTVRTESMEQGRGGFCKLDQQLLVVLSPGLPPSKRIELLLDALRRLDTSGIYLPPAIRDRLEGDRPSPDID